MDYTEEEDKNKEKDPMTILEDALVLCKFGRFHLRLLLTTLIACCASMMVTTTGSYILPNAECDLNMTIIQKGVLSSMPFFGQVSASLFAGFFTDAFGRRKFLIGGLLGISICSILEGSSQTFWMLAVAKLLDGICSCFCFSIPSIMLSEMVHKHVRDRVLLVSASFVSLSLIVIALISWGILPLEINITVVEGYFVLHSWNIYFYVCSSCSLLAAISYYYFPESPKFLLSRGQENEALDILKDIYSCNTRQHRDTFPITSLNSSGKFVATIKDPFRKQFVNALCEVKNLFKRPLFGRLCLFCSLTFACLLTYSTLRMWFPQVSTIVEHYEKNHNRTDRFCIMMNEYTEKITKHNAVSELEKIIMADESIDVVLGVNDANICVPHLSGTGTYTNGMILGLASLLALSFATYMTSFFGIKQLMMFFLIVCSACSASVYCANSLITIAILISATCGIMQTALSLQQTLLVRAFPTTLRSLSASIITMTGRIGSLVGSILFPIMLSHGCMTPFITLSVIVFCITGLVYFLPSPADKNNTGDK